MMKKGFVFFGVALFLFGKLWAQDSLTVEQAVAFTTSLAEQECFHD